MKRALPNDAGELKARAGELREAILQGFRGGAFFPPLAGVALEMGFERFQKVLRDGTPQNDDELFGLYAVAHESIHLAQMITSRWFFEFVREVTRSASWAARYESTGALPFADWQAKAQHEFRAVNAGLRKEVSGYSALEVLETQAVIEGLWGAMPRPSAEKVVYAARQFYDADSLYLHILDHMVKQFGVEAAVTLGPKLCAIALQYDEPGGVMSDLLRDLAEVKGSIGMLAKMSPREILRSRRMDPHTVSRSCRELGAVGKDAGDVVMAVASDYFNGYEALAEEKRLAAMMHPGRLPGYVQAGKPIFMPMYCLFGDGNHIDAQGSTRNLTDFATWVNIGLLIRDGLACLSKN